VALEPSAEGEWHCTVRHTDGRSWLVEVVRRLSEPSRPESCGKAPGTPVRMDVRSVLAR
jgi:hypothetical protein